MRDLLTDPLWRSEELGLPIPDSRHAVSVCLPTWADNVGYEEGDPRVVEAMRCGYPRFFFHPLCQELFADSRRRFARDGEDCLVFPTQQSAAEFSEFLVAQAAVVGRIESLGRNNVHAVVFPEAVASTAKLGWQHLGSGISSRQAESCLKGADVPDATTAKQAIRERVAAHAGVTAEDVYLFPCGMNAAYAVHRAVRAMFPDRPSVQFGFPYVDTLKILEKVGAGAEFFPRGDEADLGRLEDRLNGAAVAGVFTEFPSNPLLMSPDLERLRALTTAMGIPLILDDTVAGFHNVDLLPVSDVVWSSLTKFFSGRGDVAAGSVILNRGSAFYEQFKQQFEADYEDRLFAQDAIVLDANSRDYGDRMPRINATAAEIAATLADHPAVEAVFHPSLGETAIYDRFRRPAGGYGGLLSLVLKDAAATTPRFFDALRINKGPNLGTNFSLACPFTILAHYNELEFAESCGVSRWLVRVSVGLEDTADLIGRFTEALATAG